MCSRLMFKTKNINSFYEVKREKKKKLNELTFKTKKL